MTTVLITGRTIGIRCTIPLLLIAFGTSRAVAQTEAAPAPRWQVTLDSSHYVWDVRLVSLLGDTLMLRQGDSLLGTPVARITELRVLPETILKVGDGHESAIGALAGGSLVFDLAPLSLAAREDTIRSILQRVERKN